MRLRNMGGLAIALGLLAIAVPVAAQTPIDESISKRDARRLDEMEKAVKEMRAIVFKGRDTGKPVVVDVEDNSARITDLGTRLSDLEQTLTKLNGSLETTTHELDLARKANTDLNSQVKALREELKATEAKLEAMATAQPPAAPAGGPAAEPAPADTGAGAGEAFSHARQLMLSGDYDQAEAAFRAYVQTYPDAPKTPEARYWWGKTLAVKGSHAEAATAYIGAIRGWPTTAWAPDAGVELARELVFLKKPADACQALAEVSKRYPKAPVAVKTRATSVAGQAKCGA